MWCASPTLAVTQGLDQADDQELARIDGARDVGERTDRPLPSPLRLRDAIEFECPHIRQTVEWARDEGR